MASIERRLVLAFIFLFAANPNAYGQLRPQVTPPPTKKAPAKKKPAEAAQIVVQTSPGAHVYLDNVFKGEAGSEGRVVIDSPKPGEHSLRVSLQGKRDFTQQVVVAAGRTAKIGAQLADLPANVVVRTSPEAEVFLDNASHGQADSSGQLILAGVPAGSHELRVSARGKKDYRETVTVVAGLTTDITASLANLATEPQTACKPPEATGSISGKQFAVLAGSAVMASFTATQYAMLSGSVVDETGNPVAGATVCLMNAGTGFSQAVTTDSEGHFFFPAVPPAEGYLVSAEKRGFAPDSRVGLVLTVADNKILVPPFILKPLAELPQSKP